MKFHRPCCGLYWHRPNVPDYYVWYNLVPLEQVTVEATVIDQMEQVDITQHYKNNESRPIEASYIFPLDERAAVCGFEAEIHGKRVIGIAKEKEQAKQEYNRAIARGDGAYLMEEQKADIFQVKVGNIPPGETVKIKITYVAELKSELDEMKKRFLLPTVVAPRYTPPPNWKQDASDKSLQQPLVGAGKGYPLTVNLNCEMMSDIVSIDSPSHSITKTINGRSASVGFSFGNEPMDKDVIVNIEVSQPHEPRVCFEVNEKGSLAAMVTLFPKFQFQDVRTEIVFVIDRSGSMGGSRIQHARDAMQLFMRSLPEDCFFNIVGFGSRFEKLFPDSKRYSDETLRAATNSIKTMDANFGGTELAKPLQAVFDSPPRRDYPRQVFVLTDGQVSNTNEVIALVEKHHNHTRVFTLGIGNSVSHHLVEGMARAGRGTAQFVSNGEEIQKKVMKQLKEAIQPALRKVRVDWGGHLAGKANEPASAPAAPSGAIVKSLLGYTSPAASAPPKPRVEIHQAPYEVPPVFDNHHFLVYAVFGENKPPTHVKIIAESPDGPLEVELPVDPSKHIHGKLLHTLAARAMIRDLEEGRSWMKSLGYSNDSSQVRSEIVRLGVEYQLVSKYTSFIAVEERSPHIHYDCYWGHYHHPVTPTPVSRPVPQKSYDSADYRMQHSIGGSTGRGGGGYAAPTSNSLRKCKKKASPRLSPASYGAAPPFAAPPSSGYGGGPPPPPGGAFFSAAPCAAPSSSYGMQQPQQQQMTLGDYNIQKESTLTLVMKAGAPARDSLSRYECEEEEDDDCAELNSLSDVRADEGSRHRRSSRGEEWKKEKKGKNTAPVKVASLTDIALLQSMNGSFLLDGDLASLLGVSLDTLKAILDGMKIGGDSSVLGSKVIATAAAILYLQNNLTHEKESWEIMAGKAKKFIQTQLGAAKSPVESFDEVMQAVGAAF